MSDTAFECPIRILHLEDSQVDHELVTLSLRRSGMAFTIERVETLSAFESALRQERHDVVLADYQLPGLTALDAWAVLGQIDRPPPFILVSGAIGETAAVDAMRLGFSDYLLKDNLGKLAHVIQRALEVRQARLAQARADRELAESERQLAELTEHLQSSIDQERASIAREIHDDIGGALTAVKYDLAWLARRHTHTADAQTVNHIASALDMLQHALGASQRIMMDLRPPILDQGLVAAVQWLAQGFEKRTGVKTRFHAPREKIEAPAPIQLAAYRTAQEALTNIAKHAQCSAVAIDLSDGNGVLTLEIADNGKGISPAARDKPRAFGLKGLHERAKTVDGWLDVSCPPGGGTAIILSVPLPQTSEGAAE